MALPAISIQDYSSLLYQLSNLPDDERRDMEEELRAVYRQYEELLGQLQETITDYRRVSGSIVARSRKRKQDQPMHR